MKIDKKLVYYLATIITIVVLFLNSRYDINPGLYNVVKVVDGDTILVDMAGQEELVRFIGVNTPETHHPEIGAQCYGEEASQNLKTLIGNSKVLLVADPDSTNRDRYDRLLRHVYAEGVYLNLEQVRTGHGFAITRFEHSFMELFITTELSAQTSNKGLWSACEVEQTDSGYQTQTLQL